MLVLKYDCFDYLYINVCVCCAIPVLMYIRVFMYL